MSLFKSDPNVPPQKKYFHSASVSVPISVPSQPNSTCHFRLPFGPPVIHAEPERTEEIIAVMQEQYIARSKTLDEEQPTPLLALPNTDTMNHHWFNVSGRRITVPGTLYFGEEEDDGDNVNNVNMKEEEEGEGKMEEEE